MNKESWVLVNRNGWGDMIVDYANISQLNHPVNVLFYGYDSYIPIFLKCQNNIEEVVHVLPANTKEFAMAPAESYNEEWIEMICKRANLIPENFLMIHKDKMKKVNRDVKFTLPKPEFEFEIKKPSLLFNPYSIQSLMFSNHCPLIPEIFAWLVDCTNWNIILIGQKKFYHSYFGEQPFPLKIINSEQSHNLINLVGKTKSMIDVFHIAKQCKGIVTTSNCLALWSIVTQKPALVMLNDVMSNPKDRKALKFHKEWITHPTNTHVNFDCTPEQFMKTFKEWEKIL